MRKHALIAVVASMILALALPTIAIAGERDLVIVAGGDVAWPRGWFDAHVERVGNGPGMFARIAPFLADADLRFVNLETPLTDRPFALKKQYLVATPPQRFDWLLAAGFNLFSLANNHVADAGVEGVADTVAALEQARTKQPGLWWAGADVDPARAEAPVILTPKGKTLRVALLAVGNNPSKTVAAWQGRGVLDRIAAARKQADFVIVSVHAGGEYVHVPEEHVVKRFRSFVDAGADLVLGHHPHVIRSVEHRGDGLIFYSLGNFSFASFTSRHHKTGARLYGMLPIIRVRDGKIAEAQIVPLYVNNREPWQIEGEAPVRATPFQPQPMQGAYARKVLEELQEFSRAVPNHATEIAIRGDSGWITLQPSRGAPAIGAKATAVPAATTTVKPAAIPPATPPVRPAGDPLVAPDSAR
jgi:poly-gamma-glutamate synthesis protein (capsule biosynthesis protein)